MNKHLTLQPWIFICCLVLFNSLQAASAEFRRDDQKGPRSFFDSRSGFQAGTPDGFGMGSPNVFVIGGTGADQQDATLQMSEEQLTQFYTKMKKSQKKAAQASADTEEDHKKSRDERLLKLESEHIFAGQVNDFFEHEAETIRQRAQKAHARERAQDLACQETRDEQKARHAQSLETAVAEVRHVRRVKQGAVETDEEQGARHKQMLPLAVAEKRFERAIERSSQETQDEQKARHAQSREAAVAEVRHMRSIKEASAETVEEQQARHVRMRPIAIAEAEFERSVKEATQETQMQQSARHLRMRDYQIAEKRFLHDVNQAARPSLFQQLPNAMVDGAVMGVTNGVAGGIVSVTADLVGEGYKLVKQKVRNRWGNGLRELQEKEANKEYQRKVEQMNLLQAQDSLVRNTLSMAELFNKDPEMLALCAGIVRKHVLNVGKMMHVEPKKSQAKPTANSEIIPTQDA